MKKSVLVTGGAGGIGSGIVERFIKEGFFVYVIDKDETADKKLKEKFGEENLKVANLDVTDSSAVKSFADGLKDFSLSHIVTVAGRALEGEWKGFLSLDLETVKKSVEVNLLGHMNVIHEFAKFMTEDGERSIAMISSVNGFGNFGLPAYSAAKSGLVGFMNSTVKEFGDLGIRINVVSPGTVVTEATAKEPKNFDSLLKGSALGKFATVDDVAELVFRLCNDFSGITGQNLFIDAGQSLSRIQ